MTNAHPITQRDLKIYAKRRLSLTQVAEKHDIDPKDLENAIRALFGHRHSAQMLKEFERNLKKPANLAVSINLSSVSGDGNSDDKMSENENPEGDNLETTEIVQETPPETLLEQLKTEESTLSERIISIESERKSLTTTHRANIKQLRELQDQLIAIKREFVRMNGEYETFAEKNNELLGQIANLNDQHRANSLTLSKVRTQIRDLEKVTVCVYNDGALEVIESLEDIVLDDSGSDEIYQSLLNDFDFCQDLRVKDIRTLARLKAIVTNSAREIALLFDDNALEQKFRQLL